MAEKSERVALFAMVGSIISGFTASLCCLGPLVFIALGFGGAAIFTKFEQYRLPIGAVALGLLALSFYFTYKGEEKCTPGSSCAVNPRRKKFNKIMLWVITILVLIFISFPYFVRLFLT
jgi:mercuric ion transport protein